ncbi:MAG: hypothetical protein ACC661_01345 [Verrucomicrobiales bacterium]
MTASALFQQMPPVFASVIFAAVREAERDFYQNTLPPLATDRKHRPVFVQRKPLDAQFPWLQNTLKLRTSNAIGEHLLQIWLLASHSEMLVQFLDTLGVEHDGEGAVDNLPEALDANKLKTAIDELLARHPQPHVWLYLHLFQMQRPGGWGELAEVLDKVERLATCGES